MVIRPSGRLSPKTPLTLMVRPNYDELVVHETDPADANNYPIRTLTAEESTNGSIASTDSHKLGKHHSDGNS